ncbi:MAG TPA: DUF6049 family protein [Mycobacteriales bacterium]|nr:DUF6049 family protein [Mycobacteriales bacterium]
MSAVAAVGLLVISGAAGLTPASAADQATNAQVGITVTKLTPKVLAPNSTVTVSGQLSNNSTQILKTIDVRLQAGDVLTSRLALHTAENEPPASESGWCDFTTAAGVLDPGQSVGFTSTCPVAKLHLGASGVYPLKINVNANQEDGSAARVGEANTFLPYFPQPPKDPTKVSWLWPVTDRPHRLEDGTFLDDDLATSLAPGGYLYRLLDIPASTADVPITLALDPRLVTEVLAMTRGYRVHQNDSTVDGHGRQVAADWIDTLKGLIARNNVRVVALPYADPDLVTLTKDGLGQRMSFAFDRSATLLSDLLGVQNPLPVIWPPEGTLDNQTLYALAGTSYQGLVLGTDALPAGDPSRTRDPVTTIDTQGGSKTALLTDRALDNLAARTEFPNGPRLGEQRFMAELAMITTESPKQAQNVLITPPRRWTVPDQYTRAMLADTRSPWSTSSTVQQLLDSPRSPQPAPLTYPGPAPSPTLPPGQQQKLKQIDASLDSFRDTLNNTDANTVLTPYYEALLAAASSAFRTQPTIGAEFADDLARRSVDLRDQVRIIPPSKGRYTLASSSGRLILTVLNQLPVDVTVRISATARGAGGFHADTIDQKIDAGPGTRSRVLLPTKVERSGVFAVTAQVTTLSGTPLGEPVTLRVRSTAYGGITLGITGGALGLLIILVAIRLYRRIRDARRKSATPGLES